MQAGSGATSKQLKVMIAGPPAAGKGTQCEKIVSKVPVLQLLPAPSHYPAPNPYHLSDDANIPMPNPVKRREGKQPTNSEPCHMRVEGTKQDQTLSRYELQDALCAEKSSLG